MAKSPFTFIKTAPSTATTALAPLAQVAGLFNDTQLQKGSKSFGKAKDQYLPQLGFTRKNGHWFNPDGTYATYEQKVAALKTVGTPNGPSTGTPGFPGAGGGINHTPLAFNVAGLPQSGFVPGTRAQDWLAQAFAQPYMQGWGGPQGSSTSTTPPTPTPTGNGGAAAGNGNPATGPVPAGGGGGGSGLGGNLGGSTGQGGFPTGTGTQYGGVGTGWGSGTGTFGGGSGSTPSGSGSGIFGSLLGMAAGGGSISGTVLQALANAGVGWAQNLLSVGSGATSPASGFGTFSGQPMTDPAAAAVANWNPFNAPTTGSWGTPVSNAPTPGTGNYDVNPQADLSAVDALGTPSLGDRAGSGGGAGAGAGYGSGSGWGAGSNSINTFGNNPYASSTTNFGSLLSWLGSGAGGGSVFNYAVK